MEAQADSTAVFAGVIYHCQLMSLTVGLPVVWIIPSSPSVRFVFVPLMRFPLSQPFPQTQSIVAPLPSAVWRQSWTNPTPCCSSASPGQTRSWPPFRHKGGFGQEETWWWSSTLDPQGKRQVKSSQLGLNWSKSEYKPKQASMAPTEQAEVYLRVLDFSFNPVGNLYPSKKKKHENKYKC